MVTGHSTVQPRSLYTSSPTADRAARQGLGGQQGLLVLVACLAAVAFATLGVGRDTPRTLTQVGSFAGPQTHYSVHAGDEHCANAGADCRQPQRRRASSHCRHWRPPCSDGARRICCVDVLETSDVLTTLHQLSQHNRVLHADRLQCYIDLTVACMTPFVCAGDARPCFTAIPHPYDYCFTQCFHPAIRITLHATAQWRSTKEASLYPHESLKGTAATPSNRMETVNTNGSPCTLLRVLCMQWHKDLCFTRSPQVRQPFLWPDLLPSIPQGQTCSGGTKLLSLHT